MPDDKRFMPPGSRSKDDPPLEKIHVPKPGDTERFPRRSVPRDLPPEIEQSANLYPERQPVTSSDGSSGNKRGVPGWVLAMTMFFVVLAFGGGAFLVWASQNPYNPLNPLALPTPLPQIITATFLPPTETPVSSPTPTETFTPIPADQLTNGTTAPTPNSFGLALPTVEPTSEPITDDNATPTPLGGGDTPTETTARVYPFVQLGEVLYVQNENERACNWASIAGTVYGIDDTARAGVGVRIIDLETNEPITIFTGSSSRYPDGFEYVLNNAPSAGAFEIQVVTSAGVALSEPVMVVTSERCTQNVLVINFEQVAEY